MEISMNQECKKILQSLEYAYSGAKMMDDDEAMLRIANAIAAFELDIHKDCIIANGCHCQNCKRCDGFYFDDIIPNEVGICKINKMAVGPDGYCNYGISRN